MNTMAGLRRGFVARIMLSVLQFRVNQRYNTSATPPFISIEMDHSDSAREGCTVSTLTITSEPKDWKEAIEAGLYPPHPASLSCMLHPAPRQHLRLQSIYLCSVGILVVKLHAVKLHACMRMVVPSALHFIILSVITAAVIEDLADIMNAYIPPLYLVMQIFADLNSSRQADLVQSSAGSCSRGAQAAEIWRHQWRAGAVQGLPAAGQQASGRAVAKRAQR